MLIFLNDFISASLQDESMNLHEVPISYSISQHITQSGECNLNDPDLCETFNIPIEGIYNYRFKLTIQCIINLIHFPS